MVPDIFPDETSCSVKLESMKSLVDHVLPQVSVFPPKSNVKLLLLLKLVVVWAEEKAPPPFHDIETVRKASFVLQYPTFVTFIPLMVEPTGILKCKLAYC